MSIFHMTMAVETDTLAATIAAEVRNPSKSIHAEASTNIQGEPAVRFTCDTINKTTTIINQIQDARAKYITVGMPS